MIRNANIDFLRGLSIISVVLFHYVARIDINFLYNNKLDQIYGYVFGFGWIGVYIFFIISGFCMRFSIQNTTTLIEFLKKRINRIYIPFFICSSVVFLLEYNTYAVRFASGNWTYNVNEIGIIDYIFTTLFFARELGFNWVDGAFWTLLVELKFYVMLGCILFSKLGRHSDQIILTFAIILGSIWLLSEISGFDNISLLLRIFFIAPYLCFFAYGYFLQRLNLNMHIFMYLFMISIIFVISNDKVSIYNNNTYNMFWFTILFLFCSYALMNNKIKIMRSSSFKLISYFGRISYSLYLYHQKLGIWVIYLISYNSFIEIPPLLTVSIACIIIVMIASLSHKFIEPIKVFR